MSLTRHREPVEVLLNPTCVRDMKDRAFWATVTLYIEHQNRDLTFIEFPNGPRRRRQPGDWRWLKR